MENENILINDKKINNPLDVIAVISENNYNNIILFDRGDTKPLEAINYIATTCRMSEKLAMEVINGNLHVW